ncbi:HAD family hydrolase [Pectinatus cerevisiiphilus]|uniref:HAD superfamily hydrolase (TIGR01509 family) n=1 Tax=Pectinatus cerevisiiphilus TaxID=86956 RepID=A0A4R3KAK9_9FIRM|nr:HAD family phosphatase [Pectinatus cerevisiiphilus]TCS80037.1 HAD superfamily hydrolase (TIGR01509 family) [Pectinatus cerevisiiphilus]
MKAFIFDMDGVIIDSEPMHNATLAGIMKEYHIDTDAEYMYTLSGLNINAMFQKITKEKGLSVPVDIFVNKYIEKILSHIKTNKLKSINGIYELLINLKKNNIPTAVASSSPMDFIKANIDKLHFNAYFKFLLSGNEVKHGKPAPDIYLAAAKRLAVPPQDCVVLEDSHNGVLAAKSAGMTCIGFHNPNSGTQDISMADIIVDSIPQIDLASL